MADIFTEIGNRYRKGSMLHKFIYINAAVFIIMKLAVIVAQLMMTDEPRFVVWLEMPSSLSLLQYRPWTILTYMFLHVEFFHILFNMLWLWWFGRIFMQFFTGKQLGGLYILGGLAGAGAFLLAYNLLPYFRHEVDFGFLLGASGAVMAIVFAVSFYRKDYEINLLFLGRIKLIWLAIAVLLLDLLQITSSNAGGHIAHIGGALFGIIFATQYSKGKDITKFINRLIDDAVNLFSGKPRFKVYRGGSSGSGSSGSGSGSGSGAKKSRKNTAEESRRPETDAEYHTRRNEENRIIDEILDKLKRSGYESLSKEEKQRLFDASKR
ncbi:MAG: rhomboid family intramembrane serine protease [Tannerella sp.]|jgi:membrane associated rhomboid family serine protease|nr:rhomboid family intramembrane serine protease [Tannerella sp.]